MAEMLLSGPEDKIAVISGEKKITYGELKERIFRLANGINDLGMGRKGNLGTMLYNTNEFIEGMFAPILTGSTTTPINWHLKGDELAYVINNSDSRTLIFDEGFLDNILPIKSQLKQVDNFVVVGDVDKGKITDDMILYDDLLAKSSKEKPEPPESAEMGILMYTGGTTGRPKGANWGSLFSSLSDRSKSKDKDTMKYTMGMMQNLVGGFGYPKTTNIHLAAGPLYHAAPYAFALVTCILRGTIITMKKFKPEEALKLIESEKASTSFMAPTLVKRIMNVEDKDKYDVSSMKSIIIAAAPCPASLKKEAADYFGPVIYEFYGSSDAAINTILKPEHYKKDPSKFASVGKVAKGNDMLILDENGNECPPGVQGELYVRNAMTLGLEYYKDPDKTQKAFRIIDGVPYFDEGEIMLKDAEGFFYVADRKKDMIISGGVNIYPAEIEEVLHTHPKIMDVAVIGVPDDDWGESVKAIVVLKPGESATEEEILEFGKENLSGYKKPKSVDFMDALPRHPDGKLMKRDLRKKYWGDKKLSDF